MSVSSKHQQPPVPVSDESSWESSVSSWVDGETEMRADELDTPYGRQLWDTYHLIGDVLRSEELAIKPSAMFYARVSRAIDEEPTVLAPAALPRRAAWRMGISGLAMAAAVASVVWVALPYITETGELPGESQVATATGGDVSSMENYVYAHRDISGVGPVRHASFEVRR